MDLFYKAFKLVFKLGIDKRRRKKCPFDKSSYLHFRAGDGIIQMEAFQYPTRLGRREIGGSFLCLRAPLCIRRFAPCILRFAPRIRRTEKGAVSKEAAPKKFIGRHYESAGRWRIIMV